MVEELYMDYEIKTMELDFVRRTPLARLCGFAMDAADAHSIKMELGQDTIKVEWYPSGRRIIKVRTWPSGSESRYAFREFQLFDGESGKMFGSASSVWVMIDLERGRPLRVSEHLQGNWELDETKMIPLNFDFKPEDFKPTSVSHFPVRLSDIDPLNHVHNLHYIEWITESVPDQLWKEYEIEQLLVEFRNQAIYGDTVDISTYTGKNDARYSEYIHLLGVDSKQSPLVRSKTIRRKI
jgi:medium-chain acyl-[acyl-carrier-protein] hydrolase